MSYMVVGIKKSRIFTINNEGNIYTLKYNEAVSYRLLNEKIDHYFPSFNQDEEIIEDDILTKKESSLSFKNISTSI